MPNGTYPSRHEVRAGRPERSRAPVSARLSAAPALGAALRLTNGYGAEGTAGGGAEVPARSRRATLTLTTRIQFPRRGRQRSRSAWRPPPSEATQPSHSAGPRFEGSRSRRRSGTRSPQERAAGSRCPREPGAPGPWSGRCPPPPRRARTRCGIDRRPDGHHRGYNPGPLPTAPCPVRRPAIQMVREKDQEDCRQSQRKAPGLGGVSCGSFRPAVPPTAIPCNSNERRPRGTNHPLLTSLVEAARMVPRTKPAGAGSPEQLFNQSVEGGGPQGRERSPPTFSRPGGLADRPVRNTPLPT